jgi:hypothetical protein
MLFNSFLPIGAYIICIFFDFFFWSILSLKMLTFIMDMFQVDWIGQKNQIDAGKIVVCSFG